MDFHLRAHLQQNPSLGVKEHMWQFLPRDPNFNSSYSLRGPKNIQLTGFQLISSTLSFTDK